MKIIHRLGFRADDRVAAELRKVGIEIVAGELSVVIIAESDPRWANVLKLLEDADCLDIESTKFTKREIHDAKLLKIGAWHLGYPQPEDDFGYLEFTYDLSEYCQECDVGKKQKAPFRMLCEPRWGTKQFVQLNWVFDAFFARPELWLQVFQPLGISYLPVLHHKSGKELETVVQCGSSD